MDEFFEYWELLPESSEYETIGQEIVRYKRNLQEPDVSSMDLSDNVVNFLQTKLVENPYPTNNIIYHIIDSKDDDKNHILEEIIFGTLIKFIDQIVENPEQLDKKFKLYNLLSNAFISDNNKSHKLQSVIIPALYDLKENRQLLDDALYFALLSRNSLSVLKQYLDYEHSQIEEKLNDRTIFLKCYYRNRHWIDDIFNTDNEAIIETYFNRELFENISVCKMILNMSNDELPHNNIMDINPTVIQNNLLRLCFLELSRQNSIVKFLSNHSQSKAIDTTKSHIMTQLIRLQIPFTMEKYDMILRLLKENYEINLLQLGILKQNQQNNLTGLKTEMQLFNEYMIIKLYLQKIFPSDDLVESSETCVNNIRSLLKTINDGRILFYIIQTVLYLIFLRYEHVRKTRLRQRSNMQECASNQNNKGTNSDSAFIDSFNNQGFLCYEQSLEIILNSIRLFLMSLDITEAYKNCDDTLKKRFLNVLQVVDAALWKLNVIKSYLNSQTDKNYGGSSKEWLFLHDDFTKSVILTEKASDEERIDSTIKTKSKSPRKKMRKRSKYSELSDKSNNTVSKDKISSYATENSNQHSEYHVPSSMSMQSRKSEGFMEKMLMRPESLVILCVKMNDRKNVQKIIKDYDLKNTNIELEIDFLSKYDDTLNILQAIIGEYNNICDREKSIKDCNEIKDYAKAGFEIAKFMDAIEKYSSNDLKHVNHNEFLLDKLISQIPNLYLYKNSHLIVTSIIDFIISLPNRFDLTSKVSKFIVKRWNFNENEKGAYFIAFLKRIVEILNLHIVSRRQISLLDLINNEIISFDPATFKVQFENRENFKVIMEMDSDKVKEETFIQESVAKMTNFNSEINYINRIYNYAKNIRCIAKYQSNEFLNVNEIMMNVNIYDLIGKIVFILQYDPEVLETYAYNSSINLPHTLGIAGGSEFMPPSWKYVKNSKHSNECKMAKELPILNVENNSEYFDISNTIILYYIKKFGSFLSAYLIKEIQSFNYKSLKYDEPNFFERLRGLESVKTMKRIYGNNSTLAALNYDYVDMNFLCHKISKYDINEKMKIMYQINEKNRDLNKVKFNEFKDNYIETLIEQKHGNMISLLIKIGNIHKFNELLLKHIKDIPFDEELEALLSWSLCAKNQKCLSEEEKTNLEEWLIRINIYRKILALFKNSDQKNLYYTWIHILELAENKTSVVINFLINIFSDLELCNQFLKFHSLQQKNEDIYKIFIQALNNEEFNEHHNTLFNIIQISCQAFLHDFYDYSLDHIHNIHSLKYILNFLIKFDSPTKSHIRYQKYEISCKIIEHLDVDDLQLFSLAPYPLILIEQILMNSKLEILNIIVKDLRKMLPTQPSCNLCNSTSKNYQIGEVLVYDFDAQHNEHRITNDCLDFLFKIYAAKALDFQIIDVRSQSNPSTHSGTQSPETTHQMPNDIPSKDMWVPDTEAAFCMCCKKSKFSLLNRRHHCRRCGRVICGECSRKRVQLPERYNDLMVRCCDDCFSHLENNKRKFESGASEKARSTDLPVEWKLTGNIETDELIRDEFTYEYSPNVGRCIAIICLHTINDEFNNFLLFHCHRLELLLRPIHGHISPEIDIILVGSMLKYLAKTAKLFGDVLESNAIIDQIDILLKIAENDCDSLISKASFNSVTNNILIRDIVSDLIKMENWNLALELSVKWDRSSTSGIFSAWTVSLIRGGQYKLAREKMSLALQTVGGNSVNVYGEFIASLDSDISLNNCNSFSKRPAKSSPLLLEILEIIDSTVPKINKERCPAILKNNSSPNGSSENFMQHLQKIMNGDYRLVNNSDWSQNELMNSPYYDESIYYLGNYGGNTDILEFLMKNNLIKFSLRFALIQQIPFDMFIQLIVIPTIKNGDLAKLINDLKQIDEKFTRSKNYLISLCKYLERKKSLRVLYRVQVLVDDKIRASLTLLKFYLEGSGNYSELHNKARHLTDARDLLQLELEAIVENNMDNTHNDIQLKWNVKSINDKINIISLQLEVSKYLAKCEEEGFPTLDIMPKIFPDKVSLKTLLGKDNEKHQVAILLLVCGQSIETNFGLCYRIIQECSLNAFKIYSTCTKYLSRDLKRLIEVEKLINCIKTNASCGENNVDPEIEIMCDDLISTAIEIAYNQHSDAAKRQIDQLINLISSIRMKIQCYINSNQLKTAFLQSALINNLDFVKRIMKLAENTRQESVRKLCEKKLQQYTSSSMNESENMNNELTSASVHK